MQQKQIMHFILLAGMHQTDHPTERVKRFRNGKEEEVPLEVTYKTGDLVPSYADLEARWPEKFQRMREANPELGLTPEEIAEVMERRKVKQQTTTLTDINAAAHAGFHGSDPSEKSPPPNSKPKLTPEQDGLDALSYQDLRKLCEAEEVPGFESSTDKKQILVVMRAAGCQAPKRK